MKLSRFGICSRSEGTFGLSRRKCTLSSWMKMTCLIMPRAEFNWQVFCVTAVKVTGWKITLVAKTRTHRRRAARNCCIRLFSLGDMLIAIPVLGRVIRHSRADGSIEDEDEENNPLN